MPRLHYAQLRYLSIILLAWLAVFFLTRSVLLIAHLGDAGVTLPNLLGLYGVGLIYDLSVLVYAAALSGASLAPCWSGSETAHSCYALVTPPGEGTGVQYPEYPTGYPFQLAAGNQAAAAGHLRYRAAVVQSVSSATGAFPTRGDVTLMAFVGAATGPELALLTVFVGATIGAIVFILVVAPVAINSSRSSISS